MSRREVRMLRYDVILDPYGWMIRERLRREFNSIDDESLSNVTCFLRGTATSSRTSIRQQVEDRGMDRGRSDIHPRGEQFDNADEDHGRHVCRIQPPPRHPVVDADGDHRQVVEEVRDEQGLQESV